MGHGDMSHERRSLAADTAVYSATYESSPDRRFHPGRTRDRMPRDERDIPVIDGRGNGTAQRRKPDRVHASVTIGVIDPDSVSKAFAQSDGVRKPFAQRGARAGARDLRLSREWASPSRRPEPDGACIGVSVHWQFRGGASRL